ncbi:hypothetical protein PQX77_008180 [Marasmius sp. AFHP31]|nr:hypothetical protein PQX77_008180 [Marasmius sp. AFHP31]
MSAVNTEEFVSMLVIPLLEWQNIGPGSEWNTTKFGRFCDTLELDSQKIPAPDRGWGLEKALSAWGRFSKDVSPPSLRDRGDNNDESLNMPSEYIDTWDWVVCNEVGWNQVGAPLEEITPRLVSRYYTSVFHAKYCESAFPDALTDGEAGVNRTISTYGGWDVKVDRMVSVVGKRDPWREATLGASSLGRSGTDRMPLIFAEGGTHCSDMEMSNRHLDATIGAATDKAIGYMKTWIDEWTPRTMAPESQVAMWPILD